MITDDHLRELDGLVKAAIENDDLLSEWEQNFMSDWADKIETYQAQLRVSAKQQEILDRIAEKMRKAGAL